MNISQRFFPVLLISTVILFIWPGICLYPQSNSVIENAENRPFIILVPADSIVDGFPVLREIQDDDTIGKIVYDLAHSSYMKASIKLYHRVQNFLVNTGKQDRIEPAYLLLSQHEGGFPRHGFYLKKKGSLIDNTSVSYVELVKNNTKPEDYLGSMTQIFPHEMGHVLYHLLSADSDSAVPYATDVHYSTLITDYRTAFNEGFAIHFENMARKYEPDSSRKNRILADYKLKEEKVKHRINPFMRDFKWPLRIGIYRAYNDLLVPEFRRHQTIRLGQQRTNQVPEC